MKIILSLNLLMLAALFYLLWDAAAPEKISNLAVAEFGGKPVFYEDLAVMDVVSFYEAAKKTHELTEIYAKKAYVDHFFQRLASEHGMSVDEAKHAYESKHISITEDEVAESLAAHASHPSLVGLSEEEKAERMRMELRRQKLADLLFGIVAAGLATGDFILHASPPPAPRFEVGPVAKNQRLKYDLGNPSCGEDCPVIIVEYSDYLCPYCRASLPAQRLIFKDFADRVSWYVREMPVGGNGKSMLAAAAGRCAAAQGQFTKMYQKLMEADEPLSERVIGVFAQRLRLEPGEFMDCVADTETRAAIEASLASARRLGVRGTPSYFINGRLVPGAMSPTNLKAIVEEELARAARN